MGQYLFRLPDIGEGVAEAEIVAWHIKPGDHVREDQPLLDVMTDKATVDMTSPVDGTVVALHGDVGGMAPVGSVLVEMDVTGEAVAAPVQKDVIENARAGEVKPAPPAAAPVNADPTASPATRRRAMEWGIRLEDVPGTGPHGRILTEDLERHRDGGAGPARPGSEKIKITGLRRRIADRMQESKRHIPHFTYVEEFDLTELESLRHTLNDSRGDKPKLTLLPFFMRALVRLVPDFPNINAHYHEADGELERFSAVHIGIAAQTANGLMVPVVRHAEQRDLWDCARELGRVTQAARDGKAGREELSGSTITLTSLGPMGGIAATPIINHPEVAIIGPNKLVERPVVDGAFIARRKLMNLSASFDHRIIDGYDAARFVQQLKRLLEHPALLFLE
ncbi:MAG: catalytic domain of component of various dehydrogenase complexe [Alphaproteobacteria bacterium]|nr:catalytic domain of component of various dehydrogenase complexe [Alphaproteobacteria bacterium]MDB5740035.1 catalytic domain of component of various dehydrogenase complexe [Alphaproteobacteria bacterium]